MRSFHLFSCLLPFGMSSCCCRALRPAISEQGFILIPSWQQLWRASGGSTLTHPLSRSRSRSLSPSLGGAVMVIEDTLAGPLRLWPRARTKGQTRVPTKQSWKKNPSKTWAPSKRMGGNCLDMFVSPAHSEHCDNRVPNFSWSTAEYCCRSFLEKLRPIIALNRLTGLCLPAKVNMLIYTLASRPTLPPFFNNLA